MLLPSDVARLVLGYLQQENLTSTCQTFILESSHLKEYAEHCTDEGFIPACLLSLFGKNLTTILNEYVAMKTKETSNHVPAIMSSLWKKLDHTLSQIRSMQGSPGFAANQRARTRSGIAEIKRQRRLASQVAPVSSELLTLPYLSGQFTTAPLTATQVIRPTSQTSVPLRSNFVVVNHSQSQDTVTTGEALNIIPGPQEKKTHASLMSPGRRKSDSQRKNITLSGPQPTIRNLQDPNAFAVEKQMVIENAREKILSNKSLQEKLAENINKFLTSDSNIPQAPKQTDSNPTEPETSIDELLGLQNEIHMSEEAIQDILEQTESDPAFQALFDLFDYGKTKNNKNLSQGISSQHMETNPNVVLADETNLTVKGSFKTEESDDQSGQHPLCTSYPNEDISHALKNGSNRDELRQEAQEHFSQIGSNIQKKTFKTIVPTEQKCNLDITFESVPNLNDFNQRVNSNAKCSQHCAELYTNQMSTETEMAMEVEDNSLSPNVPNESQLQPGQSDTPVTSFVSLGETKNENLILPEESAQLLSQNIPLTVKPSKKSQFCESSNNTGRLKTNCHDSKSPDSREIHQSIIEINDVLPVTSQLSDCQDNSSLPSKISMSVESSSLNVSEQEVHLGDSVSSVEQPSNNSSFVELNHTECEIQPSKSVKVALDSQEPSSSVKEDGNSIFLSLDQNENCGEVALMPPEGNLVEDKHSLPSESVCSSVAEFHPESQNTSDDKPASNNSTEIDASNIVSLKIIISDDSFVSSETELNSAVSSISGENMPTIILSSAKSPAKNAELVKCLSSEETAGAFASAEGIGDAASMEQSLLVLKPEDSAVNNTQSEDNTAFSASVTPCVSKDGGYIQLMPATSTTFGNSNNILIATCVTDPTALGTTVSQSNVVVLPGNSAPMTAQPSPSQLQTPPRSNSIFSINQAVSPNFSQGSAIIIASPVQPVLQGMVGMIPVSVVGQNGNTFSTPQQVLHMPLAAPVCNRSIPQFPLPAKSQKTQGLRNKPCTGKQVNNLADSSSHLVGCHAQRIEVSDKNIATDHGKKLEEITVPFSVENIAPISKPVESHRRVLCFDSTTPPMADTQGTSHKMGSQNKERKDISFPNLDSPMMSSTLKPSSNTLKREREKPPMPKILSKSETAIGRHTTIKEAQSEKKVSPTEIGLESFHKATANKENELCSDVERQKNSEISKLSNGQQIGGLRNEKTIASLQELTKKQGTSSNSKNVISVGTAVKDLKQEQNKSASSLINPLSKHTTEMLQDVQRHSPVSRLVDSTHLSVSRTPGSGAGEKHKEEPTDGIKVPSSRRLMEDSSTPKVMVPPVTPDLPACSPASEAGSENSVNMAAHTLMILSRAAISRTTSTTPLKDNTQQFRASSRNTTKKRKIEELDERERNSRTSNKNLSNSSMPMKKKRIKKKKLPSSFPAGMDVDKFLLSLHYDE
ncbi:protein NPAT [Molossus molossus]|uniref:Nuclear protein, coactivator of histone transcription n=1 Tax=Molossus molossus TaxID=27622 RepID=A0A7J8ESW0_MOLMO|nr:protein NPAT [Molossus molossus]KAF6438401.1 nuclear protein, coactivator of histone transcription [Molossus molossus]